MYQKLDTAEEKISELKYITVEIIQSLRHRENKIFK